MADMKLKHAQGRFTSIKSTINNIKQYKNSLNFILILRVIQVLCSIILEKPREIESDQPDSSSKARRDYSRTN